MSSGRAGLNARRVQVLDAHEPAAAGRPGIEPARERRDQGAEVQRAGGRGREPADVHGCLEYTAPFFPLQRTAVATVELTKDNFEKTVNENPMVIVDFWAPWCGPCRGFAPVYEKASEAPDVVFAKVNTDEQQELAGAFNIRSIPTLMVFREKVILFQQAGALPGQALEQVITQAKAIDMAKVHAEIEGQKAELSSNMKAAMSGSRIEKDSFGTIEVPAERLWGAQTERSRRFFRISGERMPLPVIYAPGARQEGRGAVNAELELLQATRRTRSSAPPTRCSRGRHDGEFPLVVWQTGSGTQTNMNVNEVLANRASELLGGERGRSAACIRTTTSTSASRRTTSSPPRCTSPRRARAATPAARARALRATLARSARRSRRSSRSAARTCRTRRRSRSVRSSPATCAARARAGGARAALPPLYELAIGGTAVGTGLNTHPSSRARLPRIARETRAAVHRTAKNKFAALAGPRGAGLRARRAEDARAAASEDRERHPPARSGRARAWARSASRRTSPAARSCRARSTRPRPRR